MNQPDDWLKTGWAQNSQTRTRLVDSLLCITCSLENNTFFVLHYVIKGTLHYLMLHGFEIHSVLELSRAVLFGCRLAASRLREAARWPQLTEINCLQYMLNTEMEQIVAETIFNPVSTGWYTVITRNRVLPTLKPLPVDMLKTFRWPFWFPVYLQR